MQRYSSGVQQEAWSRHPWGALCGTGYWAVVQSSLRLSGSEIWSHLKPCMKHEDTASDGRVNIGSSTRTANADPLSGR